MESNTQYTREKVLWMVVIPQIILLIISIIWICAIPKDNVSIYLKVNYKAILEGVLAGLVLALSGYVFYRWVKKTKIFYSTAELFEQVLSPAFKNLKTIDIILLSLVSGFSEEVFFRGLLLPKFGIILSSIGFGMLHLPGFKFWIYALWAFLSGVLLGYLFIWSGSLWLPITAHAVNNIVGMFLLRTIK